MKYQILTFPFLSTILIGLIFQGCSPVSKTIDKETGAISEGGVVSSKDHYSLLIQKRLYPDSTLNYLLYLHAASKVMLSDSLLNSKGTFELFLANGNNIIIEGAECENDPLGFGASIGFTATTTEEKIKPILNNPIQKITVFGILETEFSPKQQKEQHQILNILIDE